MTFVAIAIYLLIGIGVAIECHYQREPYWRAIGFALLWPPLLFISIGRKMV